MIMLLGGAVLFSVFVCGEDRLDTTANEMLSRLICRQKGLEFPT